MKILIIGFFTKTYMPYIEKYEQILIENDVQYDILYFDRNSSGITVQDKNVYTYRRKTTANKLNKIMPFFGYKIFIQKLIKKNNYDKLIVLTTLPAVFIERILLKKYRGNFIFDYRDYTYEKYNFFKKKVNRIVEHSYCTFISSKGYMKYLSESSKLFLAHNISNESQEFENTIDLKNQEIINIGFLGYVRYFDVNSRLIASLNNCSRYQLTYIGTSFSDCDLEAYCKRINAFKVKILGQYDNHDKARLYSNISLINSMYSLNSEEVELAIPNRLYDAALFRRPIITTKGTYLAELVEEYKLGFNLDPFNDDIKEQIDAYIESFDMTAFDAACKRFLMKVRNDENKFYNRIQMFLRETVV